jgi:hypothetical protein
LVVWTIVTAADRGPVTVNGGSGQAEANQRFGRREMINRCVFWEGLRWLFKTALILTSSVILQPEGTGDKLPVPDAAARAKAEELVREVYGEECKAADTPDHRLAVARKLLDQAATSEVEPATRFVLLRTANEMAVLAGDAATALEAVDRTAQTFEVDAIAMKADCLEALSNAARLPPEHGPLAQQAFSLIAVAVAQDNFEAAARLVAIARRSAQKARNYTLLKEAVTRGEEVAEAQQAYADFQKAMARLQENPTDPQTNLVVGRWYCFTKGDWEEGIPMLALCGDPTVQTLARAELKGAPSASEQLKLGDGWWDLSEKVEGAARRHMILRSAHWYRQAVGELEGLVKIKVEERIRSSLEPETTTAATAKTTTRRRTFKGRIFAGCDEEFVMYINGDEVLAGRGHEVFIKDFDFARGDVITVMARNYRGAKGFCCVIRFEKGRGIATGPAWAAYTPKSETEWFLPEHIEKTVPVSHSGGTGWAARVQKASGFKAPPIWGTGNPCYLVVRVR